MLVALFNTRLKLLETYLGEQAQPGLPAGDRRPARQIERIPTEVLLGAAGAARDRRSLDGRLLGLPDALQDRFPAPQGRPAAAPGPGRGRAGGDLHPQDRPSCSSPIAPLAGVGRVDRPVGDALPADQAVPGHDDVRAAAVRALVDSAGKLVVAAPGLGLRVEWRGVGGRGRHPVCSPLSRGGPLSRAEPASVAWYRSNRWHPALSAKTTTGPTTPRIMRAGYHGAELVSCGAGV